MSDLAPMPIWVSAAAHLIQRLPAGRYRAMNWVGRRPSPPFWATMPVDLGSLEYRCDLRDLLMREACLTGRYEPQETALLQHLLVPGMTFLDVGANWGYFTLAAAHLVGARGRIIAVEADPRAARTLKGNVARNNLAHVGVIEAAASDVAGTLTMQSYGAGNDESSNFGVASTTTAGNTSTSFAVPARPLDDILDECGIRHVDLMKMDIEGAEMCALAGLTRHLAASHIDRVILELHPDPLRRSGVTCERVVSTICDYGYRAWRIDHSRRMHRRSASRVVSPASLLTPLAPDAEFGSWPHLLFVRAGVASPSVT